MNFSFAAFQDFSDPYAVLGLSISADDKRILKQYHAVAKQLHPDCYVGANSEIQEFVSQLIARVINPAYAKLKQEKNRSEVIALLRLQVKQMMQNGQLVPKSEVARQLMRQPVQSAEIFYEQQVSALAAMQYQSFEQSELIIYQLRELNWVYLQLKIGDSVLSEQRSGLISHYEVGHREVAHREVAHREVIHHEVASESRKLGQSASVALRPEPAVPNAYASRHYERAQQYMQKAAYDKAIQELKDALRMEANKSEYHALLSYAYLCNNLPGMATVYARQALKLNPEDLLAKKIAKKLNLQSPATVSAANATPEKGRLFGLFKR